MEYTLNADNFSNEVLKSDIPVLVDFYADWCGPCQMMMPIIKELAETYNGKIKIGKVNADENTELAEKYGVMSIPCFKFFKGGQEIETIIGGVGKDLLEEKIKSFTKA